MPKGTILIGVGRSSSFFLYPSIDIASESLQILGSSTLEFHPSLETAVDCS